MLLFFATVVLFWIAKPQILLLRKGAFAQSFIALTLVACALVAAYLGITKRLTAGRILLLLFVAGYILRVGYMLYSPAATRQHDTYSSNFNGHEAYAWTLFKTGKLPTTNDYQFYHPPLNAIVQAGFMKGMQGVTAGLSSLFGWEDFTAKFSYAMPSYITDVDRYYLFSTCQILSVAYSFLTAAVLVKTVYLFDFSNRTKVLLSAFVIFYPRQIQFAGMLNNDPLAYLLAAVALYAVLKWQKGNKGFRWIIVCAFAVGLGMMAKLSAATVCLPIAGVFIYEFVRTLRKKDGALSLGKMIGQYALFLAICAPIGLWFQAYANQRFGQSFGFVFSNLNKKLYTGEHSLFSRFIFPFDLSEFFGSIYCRPFSGNYYLFNYALRASIFGEFSYWQGEGFAVAAICTAYLSAGLLTLSLVWATVACVRTRKDEEGVFRRAGWRLPDLLFIGLLVLSQTLSEVYFYLKMPYGCTMDFRYIMPLILGMALLWGYVDKALCAEGGKASLALRRITTLSIGGFLATSALFYCVCI